MLSSTTSFEEFLHKNIPSTHTLGFSVLEFNSKKVQIKAPLSLNLNHQQTAFGGSINSVLVTYCWSMLYHIIKHSFPKAHIVIQKSNIEYLKPVSTDIVGECKTPPQEIIDKFIETYNKFGKARINLSSTIKTTNNLTQVEFTGVFVAFSDQ